MPNINQIDVNAINDRTREEAEATKKERCQICFTPRDIHPHSTCGWPDLVVEKP